MALVGKGNALREMKQFELAVEAYRDALKTDPEFAECFFQIGNIYNS
jgi:tetratricopeptide (TPR) repeat protein